jgi:hypothetical protein
MITGVVVATAATNEDNGAQNKTFEVGKVFARRTIILNITIWASLNTAGVRY